MRIQLTSVVSVRLKVKTIAKLVQKLVLFHHNFDGFLSSLDVVIKSTTNTVCPLYSSFTSSRGRESSKMSSSANEDRDQRYSIYLLFNFMICQRYLDHDMSQWSGIRDETLFVVFIWMYGLCMEIKVTFLCDLPVLVAQGSGYWCFWATFAKNMKLHKC